MGMIFYSHATGEREVGGVWRGGWKMLLFAFLVKIFLRARKIFSQIVLDLDAYKVHIYILYIIYI